MSQHALKVRHTSFLLAFSVVLGVEQPSSGGWFCGSAAISSDNWNCNGAVTYYAGPALSLSYTGLAAQVISRRSYQTTFKCVYHHLTVFVYMCVAGQRVCPSLTLVDAALYHWMHFETPHFEDFSSSCFEGKQDQVITVTQENSLICFFCLELDELYLYSPWEFLALL